MFTITLAFLIFGGTSFNLIGSTLEDYIQLYFASDLYVSSQQTQINLPYQELKAFLDKEKKKADPVVLGYSFTGVNLWKVIDKFDGSSKHYFYIQGSSSTPTYYTDIFPIDENYLEVSDSRYYNPTGLQPDFEFEKTQGKKDLVKSLYSDSGLSSEKGNRDEKGILSFFKRFPKKPEFINPEHFGLNQTLIKDVTSLDDTTELRILAATGM